MSEWIDDALSSAYLLVGVIKKSGDSELVHFRHKTMDRDIIKRTFKGSAEVYQLLKRYRHPNIPDVYEVYTEGGTVTVLEEYIDGVTVGDVLQTGLYSEDGVRNVASQLCDALGFAHSIGIIHRDIKPENVMIENNSTVRLIDWNASRIYKPYISTDTITMGTTGYAAPEQYGFTQTDARADIYSLGIMMNVMLTGEHPSKLMCRGTLRKVVEHCTRIQPDERYQTTDELRAQL